MDDATRLSHNESVVVPEGASQQFMKLFHEQKKQLKELTETAKQLQVDRQTQNVTTHGTFRGRGRSRGRRSRHGRFSHQDSPDTSPAEIICNYCKEKNHMERFCLKKRNGSLQGIVSHSVDSDPSEKQLNKIASKCPNVCIEVNGIPVRCLLDSGSEVSTLTESFFNKFLKQSVEDTPNCLSISAGNGTPFSCVGILEAQVLMSEKQYKNISFIIVKDPENPDTLKRKQEIPGVISANLLNHVLWKSKKEGDPEKSSPLQDEHFNSK